MDDQLAAFDYIATRGTKAHPIQDWLSREIKWGPVPWSPDSSSKHSFNRGGRVSGLGKTGRYVPTEKVNRYSPFLYWESFNFLCWNGLDVFENMQNIGVRWFFKLLRASVITHLLLAKQMWPKWCHMIFHVICGLMLNLHKKFPRLTLINLVKISLWNDCNICWFKK